MLDIGLEIKILRERLKVSAKDLAERIGLSPSQMSRLEKGQRRVDTRVLARIARALEVEPSYFFRGRAAPPGEAIAPTDHGGLGKGIRSERRRRHLSAEELASRIGISKAALRSIEEGRHPLEVEVAERLVKALRLPANHFLLHQREMIERLEGQVRRLEQEIAQRGRGSAEPGGGTGVTAARGVPILGTVVEGYPRVFGPDGQPAGDPDDFVFLPGLGDPAAFAAQVIGDTMQRATSPSFAEGDLVIFGGGTLRSRDLALVRVEGEGTLFRQVFFEAGGRVRLQPLNLDYPASTVPRARVLGLWKLLAHVQSS